MSKLDIIICILLLIGAVSGYRKGFLMELFFLLALMLGVFLGFKLMVKGVEYLSSEYNADKTFLPYISFFIIFVAVVILVTWLGKSIKNSVDQTFLGRMDAIAGAALGLLKFGFGLSVLVWLIEAMEINLPEGWREESVLYPKLAWLAPELSSLFGGFIPFFKETFKQF